MTITTSESDLSDSQESFPDETTRSSQENNSNPAPYVAVQSVVVAAPEAGVGVGNGRYVGFSDNPPTEEAKEEENIVVPPEEDDIVPSRHKHRHRQTHRDKPPDDEGSATDDPIERLCRVVSRLEARMASMENTVCQLSYRMDDREEAMKDRLDNEIYKLKHTAKTSRFEESQGNSMSDSNWALMDETSKSHNGVGRVRTAKDENGNDSEKLAKIRPSFGMRK